MSPSELTNTIAQCFVYVHRNEAHFTYIYVYHTNVSEADNIYKDPPPNVISRIFFVFLFRSGAPPITLLTAGALTDPRLPATASNVCTTDARLGGVGRMPPQTWLRRCRPCIIWNSRTSLLSVRRCSNVRHWRSSNNSLKLLVLWWRLSGHRAVRRWTISSWWMGFTS